MSDPASLAAGLTIGLYGGSFNPAHDGHVAVAKAAKRLCRLDRLWWLVSPGNPLKSAADYLPLNERMAASRALTKGLPWLTVSDFEQSRGLCYSAETLAALQRHYPATRFVWIIGADSLASFHKWRNWQAIASMVPLLVISRPGFGLAPLQSPAAQSLARWRRPARDGAILGLCSAPAWVYLPCVHSGLSATAIREKRQKSGI